MFNRFKNFNEAEGKLKEKEEELKAENLKLSLDSFYWNTMNDFLSKAKETYWACECSSNLVFQSELGRYNRILNDTAYMFSTSISGERQGAYLAMTVALINDKDRILWLMNLCNKHRIPYNELYPNDKKYSSKSTNIADWVSAH